MGQITALIRSQIQRQYMNIVVALTPRPDHVDMLFATMFEHVQNVKDEIDNEVEKYLSLSIVTSSSFIDVMEWWTTWKDVFRTLPDGSGLPWHACNVDTNRAREQRGGMQVHGYEVVAIIVRVYLNDVLAFLH
ncbi:unnamed protein product [Sphagnum tenellum]